MTRRFDCFVILASMRTGSNMLESALAAAPDLMPLGELFNPAFVGKRRYDSLFGIDLAARAADPLALIAAMMEEAGDRIPGFRLFPDHDDRVLAHVLADPRCAKIVLQRNPLDSYLSRKIALQTDSWRLGRAGRLRQAEPVVFDPAEFSDEIDALRSYHAHIRLSLAALGQTALWLQYPDLMRRETLQGAARYVGSAHPVRVVATRKQNPEPALSKVVNPLEMARTVMMLDRNDLFSAPDFEPQRRVGAPRSLMGRRTRLMYLPIPGTVEAPITGWMQTHDAALMAEADCGLIEATSRRRIMRWMRHHPGHLRFSWAMHPLARAHDVFWTSVIAPGAGSFARLRKVLAADYGVDLPDQASDPGFGPDEYRTAFLGFLHFLPANLARKTIVFVNLRWASQASYLEGLPQWIAPHHVFRGAGAPQGLRFLETQRGLKPRRMAGASAPPIALEHIYDAELEAAAREAYRRDYIEFGFEDWSAQTQGAPFAQVQ
jgi:hypothetical protein